MTYISGILKCLSITAFLVGCDTSEDSPEQTFESTSQVAAATATTRTRQAIPVSSLTASLTGQRWTADAGRMVVTFTPSGADVRYARARTADNTEIFSCVGRWITEKTHSDEVIFREVGQNTQGYCFAQFIAFTPYPGRSGRYVINGSETIDGPSIGGRTLTKPSLLSCGERPSEPSIPSLPSGLPCSSSSIESRMNQCSATAIAEIACSEIIEGDDTRITSGTAIAAGCSGAVATAQGRQPNSGDMIGAGILGATDNAGESIGGVGGGLLRGLSAGAKFLDVSKCQKAVRVQCNPEIALRPYRSRLAIYESCILGAR